MISCSSKPIEIYSKSIASKCTLRKAKALQSIPSSKQHMIILDWDNTLFPSTYLLSQLECEIDESRSKITAFRVQEKVQNELARNLHHVGESTLALLQHVIYHFDSANIKIVTNAAYGWIVDSVLIASTFSKQWRKIHNILIENEIEMIYARDNSLKYTLWKTKCFDSILSRFGSHQMKINIITIGDQWHDHHSVKDCAAFHRFRPENICHHQIKFVDDPDCEYLCGELQYVKNLMDPKTIATFQDEGIILEFDG